MRNVGASSDARNAFKAPTRSRHVIDCTRALHMVEPVFTPLKSMLSYVIKPQRWYLCINVIGQYLRYIRKIWYKFTTNQLLHYNASSVKKNQCTVFDKGSTENRNLFQLHQVTKIVQKRSRNNLKYNFN